MRWAFFFLAIALLLILGYAAWIGFTQFRARRAGLPPPPWKSYIPFTSSSSYRDSSYPSPRHGGIVGWFMDRIATLRNRRDARGGYEEPLESGIHGRRTDHDADWDMRVGTEADGTYAPGGYYEEQELGLVPGREPYEGSGYGAGKAPKNAPPHGVTERGRSRSRDSEVQSSLSRGDKTTKPLQDPFGDDAEGSNLRDVSPRPVVDTAGVSISSNRSAHEGNPAERASMFRESL